MENLLGFIIFLVIIVISIINKIRTEGSSGENMPERRSRPISMEDIPEATRRMLYGDGSDIPVAKPRTSETEHRYTPVTPHPVTARQVEVDIAPPKPPEPFVQARPVPPRAPQPVPYRPASPPMRQPMQQTMRSQPQQTMPPPASRPVRHPVRQVQQAPPRRVAEPPRKKTPQQQPVPVRPAPVRIGLVGLLSTKNELARGILVREILGPPKAFEDFGG
jgi:hypothetical protein